MLKHVATLLLIFGPGLFHSAQAINATALEHVIESNQKITIIDIRPNALYRKNHIHNAINIPASIIDRKRLPALGRVIVYGEGIDIELLERAVASLNSKPGIQAELLEGGFSAWAARHTVVQRQRGLDSSQTKSVTYQELLKMSKRYDALVLVDLRMGEEQESLAEHFPNVRVYDPIDTIADDVNNVAVSSYILETIPKTNRKVLILIDDGNGFSERVSDKLHAAGTKRLAILVGGEQALRTRGVMTEVTRNTGG